MKLDARKKQKRKTAKNWLLERWAKLLLIAIGMMLLAILIDNFLVNRIISPLSQLTIINDNIRYYEDLAHTNAGFMDTTSFNEKIKEYTEIREKEFYNSDDKVVATITRWPYLVKGGLSIVSCLLLGVLLAVPVLFLIITYIYTYKRYKLRLERTTTRLRPGNYTRNKK